MILVVDFILFYFSGTSGGKDYALDVELFKEVDVEGTGRLMYIFLKLIAIYRKRNERPTNEYSNSLDEEEQGRGLLASIIGR